MIKKNNWAASGFGKYVSPDMVSDEFLDTIIVILLQGNNIFGDSVYSYLELNGASLRKVFSCMQTGENFKPADFGTVLAAGRGEPSDEVKEEMKKEYNMIDVPKPKSSVRIPTFQPRFFEDEE
ncbi:MAG: hypothetical protein WCJ33_00780 [Pseudomonadota bacterium]